jgi:hypothetical protein
MLSSLFASLLNLLNSFFKTFALFLTFLFVSSLLQLFLLFLLLFVIFFDSVHRYVLNFISVISQFDELFASVALFIM